MEDGGLGPIGVKVCNLFTLWPRKYLFVLLYNIMKLSAINISIKFHDFGKPLFMVITDKTMLHTYYDY